MNTFRRNIQQGFTVLELTATVAILAISAAVVIPSINRDHKRVLDTAQVAIQDALDFAKDQAEQLGIPHAVHFSSDSPMYGVVNANGAVIDPLTRSKFVVDFDEPGQPNGVTFTYANAGGYPVAAYDEAGNLTTDGTLTLSFGGVDRELVINDVTNELEPPDAQGTGGGGGGGSYGVF